MTGATSKVFPRVSLIILPLLFLSLCPPQPQGAAAPPVEAGPGQVVRIPDNTVVQSADGSAIVAGGGGQVFGTGTRAIGAGTDTETAAVSADGLGSLVSLDGTGTSIDAAAVGARMFSDGLVRLGSGTVVNISGVDATGSAGLWVQSATPANAFGSGITINIDQSAPRAGIGAWIGVALDSGGVAAFDNFTVQGSGANMGALAHGAGTSLTLNDSTLAVNGRLFRTPAGGIFFWPVSLVWGDVNELGIAGQGGAAINLNNVSLTHTVSGTVMGLFSVDAGTIIAARDISIIMSGDGGFFGTGVLGGDAAGAYAAFGGAISLENSRIAVQGSNFSGLHARGGAITAANAEIFTLGDNASAIRFSFPNSRVTLTDSVLAALGTDNIGVIATDFTSSALDMSGGSLSGAAQAIYIDGGTLLLGFRNGARVTGGNGVLLEATANNSGGTITGDTGAVLAGDIQAATRDSVHVSLNNNAAWTGAARNAGDVSVAGGALWTITGDSDTRSLNLNNGIVNFSPLAAAGHKTLTVRGNFNGTNGLAGLNTHLAGSDSPSDRLVVLGDTSGDSRLRIANAGGGGALTSGDGIRVIEVHGASNGEFALEGRVTAGLYEYVLQRGASDGNWYLSSANPDEPDQPNIRPEAPLASAIVPLGTEYGYSMLGTLHERVGEIRLSPAMSANAREDSNRPAAWGRAIGGRLHHDADGESADAGAGYKYGMGGFQAGMDIYASGTAGGPQNYMGAYLGYGRAEAGVEKNPGGDAGDIEMNAYSLGAYLTHYNSDDGLGLYADLVAQGTIYDARARSVYEESLSTDGRGGLASIESGYAFDLGRKITLEPQAQLAYQYVAFDKTKDAYGAFTFDNGSSLRGRIGVLLGGRFDAGAQEEPRHVSVWGRVNIWKEFAGVSKTTVSGHSGRNPASIRAAPDNAWIELEIGVLGRIADKLSLFAIGGVSHSLDDDRRKGWNGQISLRYEW